MSKFSPIMTCCCCGAKLPVLPNRQAYINKGCAKVLPDGSMRYFCVGRHTQQEIQDAITGIPRWTTGKVLKERERLIG